MQNFQFQTVRSVLVEQNASLKLGDMFKNMGCTSIMVVTDAGVLKAGLVEKALESLKAAGLKISMYDKVQADPPESNILEATDIAKQNKADGVLGFGGGSPMDVAKLVAVLAHGKESLKDIYGVGNIKGSRLPLVLVPTTAGTGSEVTQISIVTTGENEKKGVVSPVLLADWAVLDANLTLGLPKAATAATGIDAMVHAIEAYTSKRLKNPMSDMLAFKALKLLSVNIRAACNNGQNADARHDMLHGAMLAGMAFANAPVGGVHALAYPVGARFHVPHGLSNSLVLPHVLRFNKTAAVKLYAEIADILVPGLSGSDDKKADALIDFLAKLPVDLGLPTHLTQVGINDNDLPYLAEDAMKQTRLLINNPCEINLEAAHEIYKKAL